MCIADATGCHACVCSPLLTFLFECLLLVRRSKLSLNDKLHFTDLELPAGAALNPRVNPALPIIKVAK